MGQFNCLLLFTALLLFACGQEKKGKNYNSNSIAELQGDTTIAIIRCLKCNQAKLTDKDLYNIEKLLIKQVDEINLERQKENDKADLIEVKNYKRQYVASTNEKGEKEVWINCFCGQEEHWRTEIIGELTKDGGDCYFKFKVNLTKKKYYDFFIHSQG